MLWAETPSKEAGKKQPGPLRGAMARELGAACVGREHMVCGRYVGLPSGVQGRVVAVRAGLHGAGMGGSDVLAVKDP